MLATLNSRQIVDEIVKDTVSNNDPHDAVQISPEMVRGSRVSSEAATLAPAFTARPEPKFVPEPKISPKINPEPKFIPVSKPQAAAPSVDTAVRVTASDGRSRPKRSTAGKWLRGAFVTFLFAGGSAAATIAWEKHGDTATQMLAEWTPALASLLSSTSLLPPTPQTAPVAAAQAVPPVAQDQAADQTAATPAAPIVTAAAAPAATQADATQAVESQTVESMTRDIAAMAQQIEQLKANIAELKAGQEQMVREMAKPSAPKPIAEAKPPLDPRARVSALPPRAPGSMPPPVRKPKPVVSHTYMPAYSPPLAPPPSQAAAVPPPVAPPVATTQAVADDDGPVVRPPMPVH
ncbi:hypothetical protein ABID58_003373 [Bradyrhizobium sp. S3.2.6]|uniref:hypothetical protein n=1 Tax=Bradyrhizobium sp. S3.2.6 TaxID=3156428 RepID=UPI003395E3EE